MGPQRTGLEAGPNRARVGAPERAARWLTPESPPTKAAERARRAERRSSGGETRRGISSAPLVCAIAPQAALKRAVGASSAGPSMRRGRAPVFLQKPLARAARAAEGGHLGRPPPPGWMAMKELAEEMPSRFRVLLASDCICSVCMSGSGAGLRFDKAASGPVSGAAAGAESHEATRISPHLTAGAVGASGKIDIFAFRAASVPKVQAAMWRRSPRVSRRGPRRPRER